MAFFQVHFAPLPGAKKKDYLANKPALDELLQDLLRHGQLIVGGRYAMSVGGMWLLRVRNKHEAERLAAENPMVKNNFVTYHVGEIVEPTSSLAVKNGEQPTGASTPQA